MSATASGLLVDLGAAQRPGSAGAAFVEESAAALLASGADVRALLLDPGAPVPGTLHSRVFGSGLLRWNTATEVRRALAAGPCTYVTFGDAAVPPHVERLGVPVVVMAVSSAPADEVAERLARLAARAGGTASAIARMRIALVAAEDVRTRALHDALASRCDVEVFRDDALVGTTRAASFDGVAHVLGGAAGEARVLRSALRVPGVLWLHDGAPVDAVRAARAVVVPSRPAARRLVLAQGANGPCPPLSVCDGSDADAAAEHLLALFARLSASEAA